MKRWSTVFRVLCVLSLSAVVAAPVLAAPAKGAKAKKKGKAAKEEKVPESAEISKSMADITWGMSKDDLQKKLIDKVKEKYRPLVAKTKDSVEEDRLRNAANDEIKRIKDSFVEFKGTSTGWDVSFLRGEFTHGNDEAMIVQRDQNSQNFYFFIDGKLWKWYKAFDSEVFKGGDFNTFANSVQKRFGPAKEGTGDLSTGATKRHWLEWQDDKSRLRAVDQTDFYGFYCLVFEDKGTVGKLAQLRTNTKEVTPTKHALVDQVTAPPSRELDTSSDVVDRITGKNRATRESAAAQGGKGKKGAAAEEPAAPPPPKPNADDDPLKGLGL